MGLPPQLFQTDPKESNVQPKTQTQLKSLLYGYFPITTWALDPHPQTWGFEGPANTQNSPPIFQCGGEALLFFTNLWEGRPHFLHGDAPEGWISVYERAFQVWASAQRAHV